MNQVKTMEAKINGTVMTFGEYFDTVESLVLRHELTDLEGERLPTKPVMTWFKMELAPELAAYQIQMEGI